MLTIAQVGCGAFAAARDLPDFRGSQGGFSGYLEKYRERVTGQTGSSRHGHASLAVDKGHRSMLGGFVDAILGDAPSPCDEMAGYLSTYLARLAIKSIEVRQTVPVPIDRVRPALA